MTDLMAGSADTWAEKRDTLTLPALLQEKTLGERLRTVGARSRLREERAREKFAASRHPERGLPVADASEVWRFGKALMHGRWRVFTLLMVLDVAAAVCALAVPRLLGNLVDDATAHRLGDGLLRAVLTVAAVVVLQAALTYALRYVAAHFGQNLLADARERVIRDVLRLPLSRVESSSTGDLVTRVTRDVGKMAESVRWALPELLIASVMVVLTMIALLVNSPLLTIPAVLAWCFVALGLWRYLPRATPAYVADGAAYSQINSTLTDTVEGARTVETFGLTQQRRRRGFFDLEEAGQVERYTMGLRVRLFATTDVAFYGPLVLIVLLGAWGYQHGWVTMGQIAAAVLYTQALAGPMDMVMMTLDTLQLGAASTSRLIGIADVPADRRTTDAQPADSHLVGTDLRFAYREGHDVLHGVDLDLRPGERLAIVGPSGSGKSTLSRLISGINRPRTGVVTVGGVDVMDLPLEKLRVEVALVTQEHHVFVGSVRDNIVLARETALNGPEGDARVIEALKTVDAWDWVSRLPEGLDTLVGSGKASLTPAQAQQIALARLVIADPHTLVLDEATSLIDPRTARHLEGAMSSLMTGRTVVAIAHRLHTAHDADRIAVVIDGRIAELGSHHELLAAGGEYARLWKAWTT